MWNVVVTSGYCLSVLMQLFVSISISSDAEDEGELSFAFLIFLFPLTYLRILFSRVFPQLFCLQIHVSTD